MRVTHKLSIGLLRSPLLIAVLLLTATVARAQDARVVFPERTMTIRAAFDEIEHQTDYLISVSHTNFDVARRVKLTRNNLTVHDAMTQLLSRSGRRFSVRGHHIVVSAPDEPVKVIPEEPAAEVVETVQEPARPEIDLTKPPVDVDSLEAALRARKVEFPAEIPPEPILNKTAYYNDRDSGLEYPGVPAYVYSLPKVALRTNLLYGAAALAPNLGVEIGLGKRSTLLATGSFNRWNLNDDNADKMLCHWLASLEYRYWFCERFNGHFLGLHGFYGQFHIKGHKIPFMLKDNGSKDSRYKGDVYGAGISYGYQMPLARSWNLEFNAGVGVGFTNYNRYECDRCSDKIEPDVSRTFVAPTKLGISIVYIIK